jgi:alcohol dehydrogenase
MGGGRRIRDSAGERIAHQSGVSCFAQYTVVDRGSIVPIDRSIPLADAAVFGCAVMTGVGAVINTARIRAGDSVAIVGLGGVGLNGLLGALLAGAETVVAIDLDERKLALAKQLGASHAVNAGSADHVEQVRDLTAGGVDYAIELAGQVKAMETAYAVTRRGGEVVTAGLSPAGAKFSFEHSQLVSDEKSIRGSYMGSCAPVRDIPRFISFYKQGRLPVDRLIDGYVGFADINAGFDRLASGSTLRQILKPNG